MSNIFPAAGSRPGTLPSRFPSLQATGTPSRESLPIIRVGAVTRVSNANLAFRHLSASIFQLPYSIFRSTVRHVVEEEEKKKKRGSKLITINLRVDGGRKRWS